MAERPGILLVSSMQVLLGVDTHSDARVGGALNESGRRLGVRSVPNTRTGYTDLSNWALRFGTLAVVGVEGTGSYRSGLSRFLRAKRISVLEVNRTSRQHRRRYGKHEAGDAEAAARAVMAGTAAGEPKGADGAAESLRALRVARRSAVKAKTQAANQLQVLLSTAPERVKASLQGLATKRLAEKALRLRCTAEPGGPAFGQRPGTA
jgi:transposase